MFTFISSTTILKLLFIHDSRILTITQIESFIDHLVGQNLFLFDVLRIGIGTIEFIGILCIKV